jgi:hypothetical protein
VGIGADGRIAAREVLVRRANLAIRRLRQRSAHRFVAATDESKSGTAIAVETALYVALHP